MHFSDGRQSALNPLHSANSGIKIFVKDVRDKHDHKRALTVRPWSTIKDVKNQLQKLTSLPPSAQRLFYGPLGQRGGKGSSMCMHAELPNYRTLHDAGIYRSGETLLLDVKPQGNHSSEMSLSMLQSSSASDVCIASSAFDITPRAMRRIVQRARRGFAMGLKPELGIDGSGGAYFLRDARKVKVCVFKPADEEPYAINNPRGYLNTGGEDIFMREGIAPGEACLREVAAFLLDHDGFSSVPMTTLVEARHPNFHTNGVQLKVSEGGASIGTHSILSPPLATSNVISLSHSMHRTGGAPYTKPRPIDKVGSCQEFIYAECTMDDMSPSKLSVEEVHKIAVLDIRIMNADRNTANLLCRRREDDSLELIPIDHGFCLRKKCDVAWFDWCWLEWPQLKEPISQKTKDYIFKLNVEEEARLLKERLHIGTEALDIMRASTKLLQEGVKAGLNLYEIALLCCRFDDAGEVSSRLEVLTSMAAEIATSAVENGRWDHVVASKALENQLSPQSLLSQPPQKAMTKSMSMFTMDNIGFPENSDITMPSCANASSGSSESTDESEDKMLENDETNCEVWAASVIADVSTGKISETGSTHRQRSSSESSSASSNSSSNLSASPKGFWTKRPDSPDFDDSRHNARTVTWSPSTSPANMTSHLSRLNFTTPSPVVSFKVLKMESTCDDNLTPTPPMSKKGMMRCQSFSAFSSLNSKGETSQFGDALRKSQRKEGVDDQYGDYFRKFVDLLIARETLSVGRKKSNNEKNSTTWSC
mmetsp:Transcript_14328/g.22090  ORF Transcript_14328/g.22090 Transcript_14328/m.22090 type:complete len:763 (+) Transcript_14328:454-2742(+)|eukprot:CAMPEP_0196807882 /NCGR_PEP_ID=MMETSP1362-20130617/7858_1 /TAXON_ID=163516 /ORGANISM="Leptocylindrus danicus, Strain CCMP1856" /LENGTH=762 /DNA_ID=CAMNT_0042181977 /DNA_START=650 /DNA_END=2938 /DNA_ORIENTATION=+